MLYKIALTFLLECINFTLSTAFFIHYKINSAHFLGAWISKIKKNKFMTKCFNSDRPCTFHMMSCHKKVDPNRLRLYFQCTNILTVFIGEGLFLLFNFRKHSWRHFITSLGPICVHSWRILQYTGSRGRFTNTNKQYSIRHNKERITILVIEWFYSRSQTSI